MAIALAEAGADVAIIARGDLDATERAIRSLGRRAFSFQADLANRDAPNAILNAVIAFFQRADILVNNAGIIRRADALDSTDEDWDEVLQVNL